MSFEGFYQCFCKNGHLIQFDVYDDDSSPCPVCGTEFALKILVDDTNGEQSGVISKTALKSLVISPEVKQLCNLGHWHVVNQAVYRIPSPEELQSLRSFGDGDDH